MKGCWRRYANAANAFAAARRLEITFLLKANVRNKLGFSVFFIFLQQYLLYTIYFLILTRD